MSFQLVILGGGTAGWLAASHLAVELKAEDITITLIESKDIGVIGVGEGTVPQIKKSLQKFGISEAELLATCDCTLKQGIKFQGWMNEGCAKKTNYYYHPFSSPFPNGYDATPSMLQNITSTNFHTISRSFHALENDLSAKLKSSLEYEGEVEYAYHFDAIKFGQLLSKNATKKLGVKHVIATVVDAKLSADGHIQALITAEDQEMSFDFFVDCSGFSAMLIEGKLQEPLLDRSDRILTDTVLAKQLALDPNSTLPSYTRATAQNAGWVWDIPLQSRRGIGYVYSSQYMSEEQAAEGLSKYVNIPLDGLEYRKLSMKIGFRERFWVKNCVSLGLSQGFVEPLEATSILITDFAAELLARNLQLSSTKWGASAQYCNRVVSYVWERVIDFVQLHYCISNRKDSEFWRANTTSVVKSEELANRLCLWLDRHPQKSDFFSRFDLFDVDNYLYVLYGMMYPSSVRKTSQYEQEFLKNEIGKCQENAVRQSQHLLGHREWLTQFNVAYRQSLDKSST